MLRLQGCAQHAKLNSLLIQPTVPNVSLQPIRLPRLVLTGNSLTLRLRLVPRVRRYAKPALDRYQFNALRVEPVNLWFQGIDVLL